MYNYGTCPTIVTTQMYSLGRQHYAAHEDNIYDNFLNQ